MEAIHKAALVKESQIPQVYQCPKTKCSIHCMHCWCARKATQAREDVLAGKISTKEYFEDWYQSMNQNAQEEPDNLEPSVSYQERIGDVDQNELLKWRWNGYLCIGTRAQRESGVKASLREAIVDLAIVSPEQAEENRKVRAERLNMFATVQMTGVEDIEDHFPQVSKAAAPLPPKGIVKSSSLDKDTPQEDAPRKLHKSQKIPSTRALKQVEQEDHENADHKIDKTAARCRVTPRFDKAKDRKQASRSKGMISGGCKQ